MTTTDWIIAISTLVYVFVTGFILFTNQKSTKTAIEQLQLSQANLKPQLSMRLDELGGFLFLSIENNGHTPAKEIRITITSMKNNGDSELLETQLDQQFELFPTEKVQRRVAIWGANLETGPIFPTIALNVSYVITDTNEYIKYSRTITFSKYFDTRIYADVNIDKRDLEESLKAATRAIIRVANYLDGHQVTAIDELDILAGKSLQNDLCTVIPTGEKTPIIERRAILKHVQTNHSAVRKPQEFESREGQTNNE
jgi:hypothetical protein